MCEERDGKKVKPSLTLLVINCRKLGNGAFGEVFAGRLKCDLAPDLKAGFPVAIKTLHEHSDSYQTEIDFTIEAQIMAKFNHR